LELRAGERTRLERLSHVLTDPRELERLKTILLAAEGRRTLEDIAQTIERSRSTIQNWLNKFDSGRIAGLLDRDTPPGSVSPISKATIQNELAEGFKTGRWRSAAQIAAWLEVAHGVKRSRKSIYYWLRKNGWVTPSAICHRKQ